jgi:alcohol dehydrogenase class IV
MGAVAFQKGLGVVHSLAHPLSTKFDMHHGLANAIMLLYGVRFNNLVVQQRYMRAADALGTHDLIQYVRDLNGEIGIPLHLSSQGVKKEDLKELATLAIKDFCHPSNPRPVSEEDFLQLYTEAL